MSGVNKAILLGRLGKDPQLTFTQAGKSMCTFTLATSERWGEEERIEWHRIVMFDRLAETANQYLGKGDQVYLEGKIQTRSWNDKTGARHSVTEILAGFMQMLGSPNRSRNAEAGPPASPAGARTPAFLDEAPPGGSAGGRPSPVSRPGGPSRQPSFPQAPDGLPDEDPLPADDDMPF
ncbi:MAG: single-stranded DNA-binding protein [Deltaproteobacteria bacterium]|jgi:single-strand DNA-binding protein|nr:single-stranded DNA-binding protein [Deltaproteobacteria bacterium]